MTSEAVDLVVVGGGPAGIGPFVCAAQDEQLDALLSRRVVLVEAGDAIGAGAMDGYAIDSDTISDALLECLASPGASSFTALRTHPAAEAVRAYAGRNLPLRTLAAWMHALGSQVADWLRAAKDAELVLGSRATSLRRDGERIQVTVGDRVLAARDVVIALGGTQDHEVIAAASIGSLGGLAELAPITLSDDVVRGRADDVLARVREASAARPFVILGGSHSAFTVASRLIALHGDAIDENAIRIVARRAPALFFPSVRDAVAAGYVDHDARDVCGTTGRLFRLAGLRFECRALAMRLLHIGDAPREPRVRFDTFDAIAPDALRTMLGDAVAVVAAFGYRPRTLPIVDAYDRAIGSHAPHVDARCRVLDARGEPIPHLFGIGLASGFVPSGPLGGEPSFRGQTNGLWLYQNGVGRIVLSGLGIE